MWLCGVPELCFGRDWLVSSCANAAPDVIDVDEVIELWAGGKEVSQSHIPILPRFSQPF